MNATFYPLRHFDNDGYDARGLHSCGSFPDFFGWYDLRDGAMVWIYHYDMYFNWNGHLLFPLYVIHIDEYIHRTGY